jgi:sigma-B regulation protein RsbU (phosphoserine phosphatase)
MTGTYETAYRSEQELDLALAAELQAAILPAQCPGDCPNQVVAARNRMCGSVGGDFYDFISLNEDQMVIVIGDVVGHGVRASLMMAQIMGYLRSRAREITRPVELVSAVNHMLIDLGDKTGSVMPCSMFYALLDAPTGICFYVNTGHPRPFLCHTDTGQTQHLGSHDLLLGVDPFVPEEMCHTFLPGERLVLYTDGITDAFDGNGDRFGVQRLREIIASAGELSAEELAERVFDEVERFRGPRPAGDDETIVVVDRV